MTKKYTEEEIQSNELKLIENEENRIENEENRIENEAERVTNEIERIANEENRIENEAERVANEIVRNEFYDGFNDRLDVVNSQLAQSVYYSKNTFTKIVAHRGCEGLAPENTIPAIELAKEYGYDAVEFDIQQTIDGKFILMHDFTVDRTTNGTGEVSNLTIDYIKSLRIDFGVNIEKYENLTVPTLEEALICCKKHNLIPVIEIKSLTINVDAFLQVLKESGLISECVVISFITSILEEIRNKNHFIKIQALTSLTKDTINYCKNNNFDLNCENWQVTSELLKYANNNNVGVHAHGISSYTIYNNLINLGVDSVTVSNVFDRQRSNIKIMEINDELTEITNKIVEVKRGTLNTQGLYKYIFYEGNSETRAFCKNKFTISKLAEKIKIEIPEGFKYAIIGFNNLNEKVYDSNWQSNNTFNIPVGISYFVLVFKKEGNEIITDDDLINLKNNTKVNVGKNDKGMRTYRIYYSNSNPILRTDFSYDTCTINFEGNVTKIIHDKPFFARKGIVIVNLASTAPAGYTVATDMADTNGFELKIFKNGVLCSKDDLLGVTGIWIDIVHIGNDFIDC